MKPGDRVRNNHGWEGTIQPPSVHTVHWDTPREMRELCRPSDLTVIPPNCGTPAGYQRHQRQHTVICDPCRLAHNTYNREHNQATQRIKNTRKQT